MIETTLRICNRKSESDTCDLSKLSSAQFKPPLNHQGLVAHLTREVSEYLKVHNEYLRSKEQEERAKAKKQKIVFGQSLKSKFEQVSFQQELQRILKDISSQMLSEKARDKFYK